MAPSTRGRAVRAVCACLAMTAALHVVVACTPPASTSSSQQVTAGQPARPAPSSPEGAAMPSEARSAKLPKGFPAQVPVADGVVVKAAGTDAGGRGVWTYTVDTTVSASGLAAWYAAAYAAANWESVRSDVVADGAQLEFAKGDAQSLLRITEPSAGTSRVEATVNLAMPAAPAN